MTAPTTTRTKPCAAVLDDEPAGVAAAIVALLRVLPPPSGSDVDDTARAVWFARNAALLDAIALAAAHPTLAADATHLARQARVTARTYLTSTTSISTSITSTATRPGPAAEGSEDSR